MRVTQDNPRLSKGCFDSLLMLSVERFKVNIGKQNIGSSITTLSVLIVYVCHDRLATVNTGYAKPEKNRKKP